MSRIALARFQVICFMGAAQFDAIRIALDLDGGDAFDIASKVARECFGQRTIKSMTITHSSDGQ